MTFNKSTAARVVKHLDDAELARTIDGICSAFDPTKFPGVVTLSEVRQLVDVLEHERGRREKATAEHPIRPRE